jgi:PhnB protein
MSHYPPISAHLAIPDVAAALKFYGTALDAAERLRLTLPDGTVAHGELDVNGGLITLGAAGPMYGLKAPDPDGPVEVAITLSVPDVDAAFARAVEAGATAAAEPADQFHGDRTATVRDPYGHKWIFQAHLEDLTPEQMQQRLTDLMSGS